MFKAVERMNFSPFLPPSSSLLPSFPPPPPPPEKKCFLHVFYYGKIKNDKNFDGSRIKGRGQEEGDGGRGKKKRMKTRNW